MSQNSWIGKELVTMPDGSTTWRAADIPDSVKAFVARTAPPQYWAQAPSEYGGDWWWIGTSPMRERTMPWIEFFGEVPLPKVPPEFQQVYGPPPTSALLKGHYYGALQTVRSYGQAPDVTPTLFDAYNTEIAQYGMPRGRPVEQRYGWLLIHFFAGARTSHIAYHEEPLGTLFRPTWDVDIVGWQMAVANYEPETFPIWANFHFQLPAYHRAILAAAQEAKHKALLAL